MGCSYTYIKLWDGQTNEPYKRLLDRPLLEQLVTKKLHADFKWKVLLSSTINISCMMCLMVKAKAKKFKTTLIHLPQNMVVGV